MAHFVDVPSAVLFARLEAAGFTRGIIGREVTYTRVHDRDERLSVVVCTSVAEGAQDARGCGQDAIRVMGVLTWLHRPSGETRRKWLFVSKVLRVTSVEGVLERTIGKAREAYQTLNEWRKAQRPQVVVERNHRPMPASVERNYERRGYTDDDAVDDWRDRNR